MISSAKLLYYTGKQVKTDDSCLPKIVCNVLCVSCNQGDYEVCQKIKNITRNTEQKFEKLAQHEVGTLAQENFKMLTMFRSEILGWSHKSMILTR
jgi:hypothetical protein